MASKTKLSKGLLDMKFMKRTKEKVIKEEDDAEGRAMYSNEITSKMMSHTNSQFIIEPSFVQCENLMEGRFSFRGMNPEIERLLELEEQARQAALSQDVKQEVTDQDMAKTYYSNLVNTMASKYQKTRGGGGGGGGSFGRGRGRGGYNENKRKLNLPEPINKYYDDDKTIETSTNNESSKNKKLKFIKPNLEDNN